MKVSMIVATLNREAELLKLLESIENLDYDKSKIEVIIVNQGDNSLREKIFKFKNLNLKYYKTNILGLSKNRNFGLNKATGQIICFPDDDCEFKKETLKEVVNIFQKNKNLNVILGKIVDEKGNNCIRNWGKEKEKITKYNFYRKTTSITMFLKNEKYYFDEELGVGEKFGSCEDSDYIFRLLKLNKNIEYRPEVILYHPNPKGKVSLNKAYSYGMGFGAFCKKNWCLEIAILFIFSINFYILKCLQYFFINKELFFVTKNGMKGKIQGFLSYKN